MPKNDDSEIYNMFVQLRTNEYAPKYVKFFNFKSWSFAQFNARPFYDTS